MDEQEEELLLHTAAGTDLWTALATLPTEDKPRPAGCLVVVLLLLLLLGQRLL